MKDYISVACAHIGVKLGIAVLPKPFSPHSSAVNSKNNKGEFYFERVHPLKQVHPSSPTIPSAVPSNVLQDLKDPRNPPTCDYSGRLKDQSTSPDTSPKADTENPETKLDPFEKRLMAMIIIHHNSIETQLNKLQQRQTQFERAVVNVFSCILERQQQTDSHINQWVDHIHSIRKLNADELKKIVTIIQLINQRITLAGQSSTETAASKESSRHPFLPDSLD